MQKLTVKESVLRTRITATSDGSRTYSIEKTIEGVKGGRGVFILLYPTRTLDNLHVEDSTNVHILNHLQELGLGEYVVVNIFSTVTQGKLSTKGLALDTDNLNFIKDKVFKGLDENKDKVIVAWGNSHQTSKVVNQAKLEILKMWTEMHKEGKLYQLTADGLEKSNTGVHPLYMGIRFSNAEWGLTEYPHVSVMKDLAENGLKESGMQEKKAAKKK